MDQQLKQTQMEGLNSDLLYYRYIYTYEVNALKTYHFFSTRSNRDNCTACSKFDGNCLANAGTASRDQHMFVPNITKQGGCCEGLP